MNVPGGRRKCWILQLTDHGCWQQLPALADWGWTATCCATDAGEVYVGSYHGIARLDGDQWQLVWENGPGPGGGEEGLIRDLAAFGDDLFAATHGGALYRYSGGQWETEIPVQPRCDEITDLDGRSNDGVWGSCRDRTAAVGSAIRFDGQSWLPLEIPWSPGAAATFEPERVRLARVRTTAAGEVAFAGTGWDDSQQLASLWIFDDGSLSQTLFDIPVAGALDKTPSGRWVMAGYETVYTSEVPILAWWDGSDLQFENLPSASENFQPSGIVALPDDRYVIVACEPHFVDWFTPIGSGALVRDQGQWSHEFPEYTLCGAAASGDGTVFLVGVDKGEGTEPDRGLFFRWPE